MDPDKAHDLLTAMVLWVERRAPWLMYLIAWHYKIPEKLLDPVEDVARARELVTSGDDRFILGSDTTPHQSRFKNGPLDVCASGCYTPHALALYAQVFEEMGALENGAFVKFASLNGPRWWSLPTPTWDDTITLRRVSDGLPDPTLVPSEGDRVIPLGWTTGTDRLKVRFRCD